MTVNRKLAQIIQRLDRIERALRQSSSRQVIAPCCQQLNDPTTGNPLPVLPPPPSGAQPEVDLACARMYAMIRRKVELWNNLISDPNAVWVYAGAVGLQGFILARLGTWVAGYMSQAALAQLYDAFQSITEILEVRDVNYCDAAREGFDNTDPLSIPSAVWDKVPGPHRFAFRLYWALTGGLQGYENVEPDPDTPLGCCLPDTFYLLPVVRTFTCAPDSYQLDAIGESDPQSVAPQVIVNRAGIPHVVRPAISGFWIRNVQGAGAFGLWGYYSDSVTNDGCNYVRSFDFDMTNMTWYWVTPTGSPYIVFRNRVSGENSKLEVSRTEPGDWNGVDTI
jgi:hypothetical protein